MIANGHQTQNNQQDHNSGIVQNLQNSHIIYNGPVYMGMHSP
ncbi:MAG: hypothetical protein Q4B28_08630 [bacterium]|nr:hypothetical protein [bacterium]